jgi:hypothetical protein
MRTCRALRPSGGRKAPTASDTASIPVSDAPPLANARRKVKIVAPRTRLDVPVVPMPMVPWRPCTL